MMKDQYQTRKNDFENRYSEEPPQTPMEALHYPSYSVPAADPEHLGLNPVCTTHSYEIWDKS